MEIAGLAKRGSGDCEAIPYNVRQSDGEPMKTPIFAALVCLASLAAASPDSESMVARANIDIRTIATALALYQVDYLRYPTTAEGLRVLVETPTDPAALQHWHKGGYLRTLPKDPWGHDYQYAYPGAHGELFDLYSLGPTGRDSRLRS
jgi:type II secretion system protein G